MRAVDTASFSYPPNFPGKSQSHTRPANLYANHLLPYKLAFTEQNKDFRHIFRLLFSTKVGEKSMLRLSTGKMNFFSGFKKTSSFYLLHGLMPNFHIFKTTLNGMIYPASTPINCLTFYAHITYVAILKTTYLFIFWHSKESHYISFPLPAKDPT